MQSAIRVSLAGVLATFLLAALILQAAPAYAGVNPSTAAVGCGLNPDDQGYSSWGSGATSRTEHDYGYCYYVWLDGHYRIGSTYYYIDGLWVGGYPSRVETYPGSSAVEVGGQHNACLSDWSGCNGYATTLAYQ